MKRIGIILLVFLLAASCEKEEKQDKQIYQGNDPIEEFAWLKEIRNSMTACTCEYSIMQAIYEGQTVFYTAMTDPLCDGIQTIVLLNVEGNMVKTLAQNDYRDFMNKATDIKNLYRCKTGN